MGHPANIGRSAVIYPPAVPTATVVVDPDGGGDVRTIAEAVTALSGTGGYIQLTPGNHNIPTPIALPVWPIVIKGAGRVSRGMTIDPAVDNGSTLVITTNAFTASFPTIVLEDLNITGGNKVFLLSASAGGIIVFNRVKLYGVSQVIDASAAAVATYIEVNQSFFWPVFGGLGFFFNGGANPGGCFISMTQSELLSASVLGYPKFRAVECDINTGTLGIYIGDRSQFVDCQLSGTSFTVSPPGGGSGLVTFTSCNIGATMSVRGPNCSFVACSTGVNVTFQSTATGARVLETPGANPYFADTSGWKNLVNVKTVLTGTTPLSYIYETILANAVGGAINLTLPQASAYKNCVFTVKKIDATGNLVSLVPNFTDLIEGVNVPLVLSIPNEVVKIVSDGTSWYVV